MTEASARSGWRRLPLRTILAVLVTGFLIAAFAGAPWDEVGRAVMAASPAWLVLAFVSNLLIFLPWVWQWQLLARPSVHISARRMFGIVALCGMGNAAMSSLVGTASAIVLLVGRCAMTPVAAASLMLMDQMLVGLAKLTVLALAVQVAPVPGVAAQAGLALAVLTLGALASLMFIAYFGPTREPETPEKGFKGWYAVNLVRLTHGLEILRQPSLAFASYGLALAKKATEIGAAYAVAAACGIEPSLGLSVLVVAAVSLSTAVPLVPGSLGVYSATVYLVYEFMGYPAHIALAAGLLQHLLELAPALLVGYGTVIASRLKAHREKLREQADA